MNNLSGTWMETDVSTNERGAHTTCLFNLQSGAMISPNKDSTVIHEANGIRRVVKKSYDEFKVLLDANGLLLKDPAPGPR